MNKKNILVIGGFGFIGKSFIKRYFQFYKNIFILDNLQFSELDHEILKIKNIFFIKGDVRDKKIFTKIPNVDYILHLGSPSSIILFNKNPNECIDITINGFINILNYAKEKRIAKLIYPSSGSVYGADDYPFDESVVSPKPINIYGKTKLACEFIARIYDKYFPIVGLRIFAGFGAEENHKKDFASVISIFINKALTNKEIEIFGDGFQTRDFIYIDDIVEPIHRLFGLHFAGIINIGSGFSVSFNEVINLIKKYFKNLKVKYIPTPNNYLLHTKADINLYKKLFNKTPQDPKDKIIELITILRRSKKS